MEEGLRKGVITPAAIGGGEIIGGGGLNFVANFGGFF